MKLLLDENLSFRLLPALEPVYPDSAQVAQVGLSGANDRAVWQYARDQGYVLVSKDDDFLDLAAHHGPPPVVIRLALGNCPNERIVQALLGQARAIHDAVTRANVGVIEIG
jgi:predicted nuclease of predicted toxin-antitoxin system